MRKAEIIKKVTAERDALLSDLKSICTNPSQEPCELCKHCGTMPDDCMFMDCGELLEACRNCTTPCICGQCRNGDRWEWRGVQKEGK